MGDERNILRILSEDSQWNEINSRIGQHLKKMRERAKLTQSQVSKQLNRASDRTYQKMEQGNTETSFDAFIEVFHLFQGTDRDAAILFGNRDSEIFITDSHDHSPTHIARLNKFTYQHYTVYFLDQMDKMKHMRLDFTHIVNDTYVQGTAKVGKKYTYDCKLISPTNSKYVYIYFTSTTSFVDRAFFVLPEIDKVVGRFKRGIGIMMSISIDNSNPALQMFALIHKCYEHPNEEKIKEHLVLKNAQVSKYMLRISDLEDRNNDFVRKMPLVRKQR